jgi:hypothetical protein
MSVIQSRVTAAANREQPGWMRTITRIGEICAESAVHDARRIGAKGCLPTVVPRTIPRSASQNPHGRRASLC